ncbi:MAG: hypothetical protein KIT16_02355 [Rhodospirillaceae bacterium]|nr:hypothetical protein [Rhodospirillaceae bacterium]
MRKGWVVGAVVVAVLAGGGYVAADRVANAKLQERAKIFARDMRKVTREFHYGSVEADLLARSIVMKNVEFVTKEGDRIKADSVEVKDFDWRNGGSPRYADIVIRRADVPSSALASLARPSGMLGSVVRVSTGPVNEAKRLLDRAGYKRTTSDFRISYRYDEETREFEIRDVKLEIADLGEITFGLKLGGVPSLKVKKPAQLLSYGTQMTLIEATVAFRDRALVSRLLKAYAVEHNISEAEALQRVLADLKAQQAKTRDAIGREALGALVRFIERPGEIRFAAEPGRPVPLLTLAMGAFGAGMIKDTFGVKITAK